MSSKLHVLVIYDQEEILVRGSVIVRHHFSSNEKAEAYLQKWCRRKWISSRLPDAPADEFLIEKTFERWDDLRWGIVESILDPKFE